MTHGRSIISIFSFLNILNITAFNINIPLCLLNINITWRLLKVGEGKLVNCSKSIVAIFDYLCFTFEIWTKITSFALYCFYLSFIFSILR